MQVLHKLHLISHWFIVIPGIRLIGDDPLMDLTEASSLTHKNDIIDVYSNSWGPLDTGIYAGKMGTLVEMALEEGVKQVCPHDMS